MEKYWQPYTPKSNFCDLSYLFKWQAIECKIVISLLSISLTLSSIGYMISFSIF